MKNETDYLKIITHAKEKAKEEGVSSIAERELVDFRGSQVT